MDHDEREDSESTPNSPNDGAQNGPKATKDKACPFCGQPFTSSSLGRHLDLYIRPRNPKPPDGVHDVNKIREMRGGITRRQPRTGTKAASHADDGRRESSGFSGGAKRDSYEGDNLPRNESGSARMTEQSPVNSPLHAQMREGEQASMYVNTPSWHATGVINNLPARAPSRSFTNTPSGQAQRAQDMRKDHAGNRTQRPECGDQDLWKLQESAEIGRAAELALREVLSSLEAAKKRANPIKLFDDFCELGFPGLCLQLLPPPPTLFSSTPFAQAHTWPLEAPGERQYDAMQRVMSEKVAMARNGTEENLPDSIIFRYQVHLQGAWEHWQLLGAEDKAVSWNLEVSRAFVKERSKKEKAQTELENAHQRIKHLEAEFDRMSRFQLPREYLMQMPRTMPVGMDTMREMRKTDINSAAYEVDYDVDALMDKWKATVKATSRVQPKQSTSNTTPHTTYPTEQSRNHLREDMLMSGSVFGVNGPMPRPEHYGGEHLTPREQVTYTTPSNPGAIVEDGEEELQYAGQASLMRRMDDGGVNGNGKRGFASLTPTSVNGRPGGPKMLREVGGRG